MFNKECFSRIINKIKNTYESQVEFSEKSGIGRTYLSQYMNMKIDKPPKPEILKRLADNSKGVTTYEELMEVCGYKEENIESYVYNSYKKLKEFEAFIKDKNNDNYFINIETVIQDFIKYLHNLNDTIYNIEYNTDEIFLFEIYSEEHIFEDYGYVIGFMILYDYFIKYLEKINYIKIINYEFLDWFKIENIYSILKKIPNMELLSSKSKNIELILDINPNFKNIENIINKINEYSNCIALSILSDSNNGLLSEFFKYKTGEHDTNITTITENSTPSSNTTKIPVLGSIPAGIPIELIEDIIDYEDISEDMLRGGKQYFALKVKGTSMFPKYLDGDTIIVLRQNDCESGQDAIVMVNGDDGTFKRVIKKDTGITLEPINQQQYNSISYSNEDIENLPIKILGVVKEIRRSV